MIPSRISGVSGEGTRDSTGECISLPAMDVSVTDTPQSRKGLKEAFQAR